ncbi:MAG: glycosyltransferase family 4 protein [Burkholderiales bacterium]|nr:glycosyltransferase family 4 protein [Phycisphaerae bacterium]
MKIALCFPGCHARGGVERVVEASARYLVSRNHDVHVFANEWDADPSGKITYHRVPTVRRPEFLRAPMFRRNSHSVLRPAEFDVVNVHGCECPTGHVFRVHSLHRAWLETSRRFRGPLSLQRIKQRLNPLHPVLLRLESQHFRQRRYQRVIALTEDVRTDLARYYDVPGSDVDVVPNGFNDVDFNSARRQERRAAQRAEMGLKPDDIALLFVANELPRKGYPVLLAALKKMPEADVKRIKLFVVGRVASEDVMKPAEELGLANHVRACGPTSDVAAFHAAADIFVLPTQYEAFCLAILEALASGLPVITTRVPGAQDAMRHGVNGLLVGDPNSADELSVAIADLMNDDRRAQMSAAAPATVDGYRWQNVMRKYEDILARYAVTVPQGVSASDCLAT